MRNNNNDSLCSDDKNLSPTIFFLKPQRDQESNQEEDINSIRLVLWQFLEDNQRASTLAYWRKVIQTKSRQALVFDPGGCTGRLRSCPFLGGRHALRIGWARLDAAMVVREAGALLAEG